MADRTANDDAVAASKDDKGIPAGTSSRPEFRKGGAGTERKVGRERLASDRQCPAIRKRIGHDQDEVLNDLIVAQLEHRPALDHLQVREPRFGLEGVDASMTVSHCVPRTQVSSAKERNLGPQANATPEPISEATDEADLTDVPDGIGVRNEAQDRQQADGQAESAELAESDIAQLPSLESINLARGYADRAASFGPAQSSADSREAEFLARRFRQLMSKLDGVIEPPVSRHHPSMLTNHASPGLVAPCTRH